MLGDNIFYGAGLGTHLRRFSNIDGAAVFGYRVVVPTAYGVVEFDADGKALSLEESFRGAAEPLRGSWGLYFYDNDVVKRARSLEPSPRASSRSRSEPSLPGRGSASRFQCFPRLCVAGHGHLDDLNDASISVRTIESRQGTKIGCPEEAAWRMGFIDDAQLVSVAEGLSKSGYGDYLLDLLNEA